MTSQSELLFKNISMIDSHRLYILILACIAPRAAPTVLNLNNTTNHPCDVEGLVVCSEGHFQTCASGR